MIKKLIERAIYNCPNCKSKNKFYKLNIDEDNTEATHWCGKCNQFFLLVDCDDSQVGELVSKAITKKKEQFKKKYRKTIGMVFNYE